MHHKNIKQAAMRLAQAEFGAREFGWQFTPLNGKRPFLQNWQNQPVQTPEQLQNWCRRGNVGLRTGRISGVIVIDLDMAKPAYDAVGVAGLNLPDTVTVDTGGGGKHLYYAMPDIELGNRTADMPAGVDVRGNGGQVVFPGSVHPDTKQVYEFAAGKSPADIKLAELPQNIIDILTAVNMPAQSTKAPAGNYQPGAVELIPFVRTALYAEVARVRAAGEGTRNQTLNSAAYSLGRYVPGGYITAEQITEELSFAAKHAGLPADEVADTIASGLRGGAKRPRYIDPPTSGAARSAAASEVRSNSAVACQPQKPATLPAAFPPPAQEAEQRDIALPIEEGQKPEATLPLEGEGYWDYKSDDASFACPDGWRIKHANGALGRLVLSTSRIRPSAIAYMREFERLDDGSYRLQNYADNFFRWQDNRYRRVEDGAIGQRILRWQDAACCDAYWDDEAEKLKYGKPFPSGDTATKNVINTLKYECYLDGARDVPFYISGGVDKPAPRELVSCANGNLHLTTGDLLAPDSDLFNYNALDFDWDPAAAEPVNWLKFLDGIWGDDAESIELLQEWFGYCLVADTSQQKMLFIQGPPRSGKGTIARILQELIGSDNYIAPTTQTLASQYGLAEFIGKSVACVSDARFSGADAAVIVERLLTISGEDTLTIERKYQSGVTLKMPLRFMFLSNELPRLKDAAGALANRFLILTQTKSFLGKEDPGLTARLRAELKGILVWAVAGWQRLHERGKFKMPASSVEAFEELRNLGSPVGHFLRDCCQIDLDAAPGGGVDCDTLYQAYLAWCEKAGHKHKPTSATFGKDLRAAQPGLKTSQRSRAQNKVRYYKIIMLNSFGESLMASDNLLDEPK